MHYKNEVTMRSKLLSLLTVIGAITVLVLAGNTVALATASCSARPTPPRRPRR
ncbi:MAG TPA: hypothetical protein VHZ06_05000 [Marmoricola sp.]|jgi:hypothetical protein|nr:hypothetical protein [Marmoricola sp.]